MILDLYAAYQEHKRRRAPGGNYTGADLVRDHKAVFGTEAGQRVLLELACVAELFEPMPGSTAELQLMAETRREIVVALLKHTTATVDHDGKVVFLDGTKG